MNMSEWDRRIAPRLYMIESGANWLSYYAGQIQAAVSGLEARPAWETMARDYLNKSERELMVTLALVRAARDLYDNLPVILEKSDVERNVHIGS